MKNSLENMLTDFSENLNLEIPVATYSPKGINFWVEVRCLVDYRPVSGYKMGFIFRQLTKET